MPKYDISSYDPPAPVAEVSLRNAATGATLSNVMLLLDTGADVTLLPQAIVEKLDVQPATGAEVELIGFDGKQSTAQVVELELLFLRKAFRGKYVLMDDDRGVLGRDVLASIVVLLDGPGQEWKEVKNVPR